MRVKDRIPEKGELKALFERGLKLGQVADQLGMDEAKISYWKTKYGLTRQGSEVEEWINEHPDVKRAFASMGKSSKRVYYTHLRKYCFWCDKEPEDLWKEDKKTAQDRVIDFREYLEEQDKSSNTISMYIAVVRRFYEYKDIVFKTKFISNGTAAMPKEENEKELIEPHMLRQILDISPSMEKAIYMIQYQSGLSSNELCNLRLRHVGNIDKEGNIKLNIKDGIIMIKMIREKRKVKFITFIGYDGIEFLNRWLDLRQAGKALKDKEIGQRAIIKNPNDYLFVGYSRRYKRWDKISPDTYASWMLERVRQLGWVDDEDMRDEGRFNPYRPHSLRMSFSEILKHRAKLPWDYVEHMLGHKGSATDKAYTSISEDDLRRAYKEGEPLLSLTPIEPVITDSQYRELDLKNELLKDEIKELKHGIDEIKAHYEWKIKNPERAEKMERIEGEVREEFKKRYGDHPLTKREIQERTQEIFRRYEEEEVGF